MTRKVHNHTQAIWKTSSKQVKTSELSASQISACKLQSFDWRDQSLKIVFHWKQPEGQLQLLAIKQRRLMTRFLTKLLWHKLQGQSGPSKYDSCDYSLCENFTSHQRARIESNSPNTRFKEHRLQSSVKTVQLWTIQQALGKTRFQASAHSQENTPDSNQANKCFSLWPKDQIALNYNQTQALRTTSSKQV